MQNHEDTANTTDTSNTAEQTEPDAESCCRKNSADIDSMSEFADIAHMQLRQAAAYEMHETANGLTAETIVMLAFKDQFSILGNKKLKSY
jgi:hypothetical protein